MPAFSCCVVLHRDVRAVAIPEVHLLLFRYFKKEVCYRNFASGTLASATFLAGTFVTATSAFFEKGVSRIAQFCWATCAHFSPEHIHTNCG